MSYAIRLRDVTLAYERRPALEHLSGEFLSGSMTAVVGPNGAGKSTLLKALCGMLRLAGGSVEFEGIGRSLLGYLPQQSEIDRSFPITVSDTVLMGAWDRMGMNRDVDVRLAEQAEEALSAVGLTGFHDCPVGSLSVGQFQRVLFARLFLQNAPVVLLDEPFAAIDERTTRELIALLVRWHQQEQRTVIAVLHDIDLVRAHFPSALLLARTPIAWGATQTVLTPENLRSARILAEQWDQPVLERRPASVLA